MDDIMKAFLLGARRHSPMSDWVEWLHITRGKTHCEICLKLDQCWFMNSNKPDLPQHPYCHCEAQRIPYERVLNEANAVSDYRKYDPYLFNRDNVYDHKKQQLFENWGYTIDDSKWLQQEIEKQALEKYVAGEYSLGRLNEQGQRISIRIEIPRKKGKDMVSFVLGWMVEPKGKIRLNTPYGGK